MNKWGWRIDQNGHVVDNKGNKKLDVNQLVDGHLMPLFTYDAREFDIFEVMGQFEKDENGKILFK